MLNAAIELTCLMQSALRGPNGHIVVILVTELEKMSIVKNVKKLAILYCICSKIITPKKYKMEEVYY